LKLAFVGASPDFEVVRQLLSPWDVFFTSCDQADVTIAYKETCSNSNKTIVVPSESMNFKRFINGFNMRLERRAGRHVVVSAGPLTELIFLPKTTLLNDAQTELASGISVGTEINLNNGLIALRIDIVDEYKRVLERTFNAGTSIRYRILTGLPIPYTLAPRKLRDAIMRDSAEKNDTSLRDKLPIDALRLILVRAIEELSSRKLKKRFWKGRKYACAVTHDVDTEEGLRRARLLKKLEEKYDIQSAWYVPSRHYRLHIETLRELANHGEIGAHGTRHSGNLCRMPEKRLVREFQEAKHALEKTTGSPVSGFRAPLLQHNLKVLRALKEAGYKYDSSVPTWEPKHPRTMRPHGLGTTFPMLIEGQKELPVSAVQDHQLLYVLNLSPRDAISRWISIMEEIKEVGGCCVFLSHPEYKLFGKEGLMAYEELLNAVADDKECWVSTPGQLTDIYEDKTLCSD
jgi:peptidoglycan/xylan/chitin deacetylase (PgdA/CDA1 family)